MNTIIIGLSRSILASQTLSSYISAILMNCRSSKRMLLFSSNNFKEEECVSKKKAEKERGKERGAQKSRTGNSAQSWNMSSEGMV